MGDVQRMGMGRQHAYIEDKMLSNVDRAPSLAPVTPPRGAVHCHTD